MHLPGHSDVERASFFARSVASHGLVSASASSGTAGTDADAGPGSSAAATEEVADGAADTGGSNTESAPAIHPLALASARLQMAGIAELSKAINLGGLVDGGDYLGLTSIIADRAERAAVKAKARSEAAAGSGGGTATGAKADTAASAATSAPAVAAVPPSTAATFTSPVAVGASEDLSVELDLDEDGQLQKDAANRSLHLLHGHSFSLAAAARTLARARGRMELGTAAQALLDSRLRGVRKKFRLAAPEHGARTGGSRAVRPHEVVAIDVEVYHRGHGTGLGSKRAVEGVGSAGGGEIARKIPRYAKVELRDGYGGRMLREEAKRRRRRVFSLMNKNGDEESEKDAVVDADGEPNENLFTNGVGGNKGATIAEPYEVADPHLGKVDVDFDPDQVPFLTLSIAIGHTPTGYAEEAVLSSIRGSSGQPDVSDINGNINDEHLDEPVIFALQHSLFCASLFESMRDELASAEARPNAEGRGDFTNKSSVGTSFAKKVGSDSHFSASWLASGTADTFLPVSTALDGDGVICVIHCHQGEVKVRLNAEYDLIVKLVEVGTTTGGGGSGNGDTTTPSSFPDGDKSKASEGGSHSSAYLRTLCRALLLHAQSTYHSHRLAMEELDETVKSAKQAREKVHHEPGGIFPGLARRKKDVAEEEAPHILRGILQLGSKTLIERSVRGSLARVSRWADKHLALQHTPTIDWLALSIFDTRSRFVFSAGPRFVVDVCIDSAGITATSFGDGGAEYRSVRFGSASEFELFLRLKLKRIR